MSPARDALEATRQGRWDDAASIIRRLVIEQFRLSVNTVEIARDHYSLNSVNGFVSTTDGLEFFFKFHHEEGEEQTLQEFYRGELLKSAGYPVDMPVFVARDVGRQILLYRRRHTPRFADVCRALDDVRESKEIGAALAAQAQLDDMTRAIYLRTWHPATAAAVEVEPIHQLFHRRLVSADSPGVLGGRARRFFWGAEFRLGAALLSADALRDARWRIDGVPYHDSIASLLERSLSMLEPARLARCGAVTAHGDAHNANVWWGGAAGLTLFDPAFAGSHVPALLAEVKATFHNILAHPWWLYDAGEAAARFAPKVRFAEGVIDVQLDWQPSPLRQAFLQSKAERVWRPLLAHLAAQNSLPDDWRSTLRCALFCCPALVMELRAAPGTNHNPVSSAIGLAVTVLVGSEPEQGQGDCITRFLDGIDPRQGAPS